MKKMQIYVQMDGVDYVQLQIIAQQKGIKVGQYTRMLLLEKLKQEKLANA